MMLQKHILLNLTSKLNKSTKAAPLQKKILKPRIGNVSHEYIVALQLTGDHCTPPLYQLHLVG